VAAAESAARSAIDKTSIVLGHSILDDIVSECCQVSALLMPDRWTNLIEDRKVNLSEVLQKPAPDISRQLLATYLEQLGRESLLKRLDILNERYQPAPAFQFNGQPYKFDRERLHNIDRHRQRIIHQLELSGNEENSVPDDLLYLEATCFYLIFIVSNKHAISVDPKWDVLDALRSKSSSPVKLAYEALLLATSLPAPNEKIWSMGGQVFVSDGHGSRQLPLLMPAAAPDLSADRQQLVFVKYRLRSGEELSDRHIYEGRASLVGDIWISAVDGAQPQLVLKGGPRPLLVPPVDGLPKELEEIASPKFDPDAKRVYFIAGAWATSGAIYILDLETREVKFFTDGNVFAVLHGAPHRGKLLVSKHRYHGAPNYGSYDHLWLVSPTGEVGEDFGEDLDAALVKLYGAGGRKLAFHDKE